MRQSSQFAGANSLEAVPEAEDHDDGTVQDGNVHMDAESHEDFELCCFQTL